MFLSLDQPRIFIICILVGIISGAYYEIFSLIIKFIRLKWLVHTVKGLWLVSCLPIYITFSLTCEFPDFRWYMAVGVSIGLYLYKLSFHKVFAIFINKVYNIIIKLSNKIKASNERRKEKAGVLGGIVGANNVHHDTRGDNNLSAYRNIYPKK